MCVSPGGENLEASLVPLLKGDLGGSSKCSRKVDSYAKSQFILKITFNSYANFAKVSADESDPITLYVT